MWAGARGCADCTWVGALSIPGRRKWMLQLALSGSAAYSKQAQVDASAALLLEAYEVELIGGVIVLLDQLIKHLRR